MSDKIKSSKERIALVAFWMVVIVALAAVIYIAGTREQEETSAEETYVYEDTVFAIAVRDGMVTPHYQLREIIFSNDHHLYCREESSTKHKDFNHPVYVKEEDLCVIRVKVVGNEETVTLVKNLTKEARSEMSNYWESDSDIDSYLEEAWVDRD